MPDTADALAACLRLMDRANPYPDDRELWHSTMEQASRILAQHQQDEEARDSFWRGVLGWLAIIAALLALGWWAAPAFAQDRIVWTDANDPAARPSVMVIQPSPLNGAVAEIVFANEDVHNFDHEQRELRLHDLSVWIYLMIDVQGEIDTLIVSPPQGFYAVPRRTRVAEGETVTVTIYPESEVMG